MQNVVDIQKREALRQGDVAAQGQAARAVQAGAFGGSRDAIIQAENERNQQTLLNDIQAKGQAAAYADAQQQYAAQQKNALAAGAQYGQLGTAVPGQAMKEFGALESVGAAKQQQEQQALNIAKQQFIQEQTFPEANLQQYSSIIRGYNLPPNTYQSAQTTTPAPSYMQQIAGLGLAGAGIAGAFGGFGKKEGGLVGLAKGGKVLRRAEGGSLAQVDILSQLPDDKLKEMLANPDYSPTLVKQEIEKRSSRNNGLGAGFIEDKPKASRLKDFLINTDTGVFRTPTKERLDRARQATEDDFSGIRGPLSDHAYETGKGIKEGLSSIFRKPTPEGVAASNEAQSNPMGWLKDRFSGGADTYNKQQEAYKEYLRNKSESTKSDTSVYDKQQEAYKEYLKSKQSIPSVSKSVSGLSAGEIDFSDPSGNTTATVEPPKVSKPTVVDNVTKEPGKILLGTGLDQNVTKDGVPLLVDKGNAITSQYTNVPMDALKQLTEKKDALVGQSPQTEGLANDIYSDAISKLQASTDKKKTAMSDRAAGLDQAKWLAVADMGFQMMAAPGGATFIQALGGAAGKSGIAGKLASLTDKQKEMAFNLAEMDEKQVMSTFGIGQAKAAASVEHAKLDLMASELDIKIMHEENAEKKLQLEDIRARLDLRIKAAGAAAQGLRAEAAMKQANKDAPVRQLPSISSDTMAVYNSMYKKLWENKPESSTVKKGKWYQTKENTEENFRLPTIMRAHNLVQRKGVSPEDAMAQAIDEQTAE
jgi:hypothetical protein